MRVDQQFCFLGEILKQVKSGGLAPAPMQRPYVWRRDDVEALCHSIMMGYPIGAIMAWRPERALILDIPVNRLGPIFPEHNAAHTLILDGHNRLATFAWIAGQGRIAFDPMSAERDSWFTSKVRLSQAELDTWFTERRLVLDVEAQRVRFMGSEERREALWIGAETLLSHDFSAVRVRYNELQAEGRAEADINRLLNLHQDVTHTFMQAKASMTTIEEASPAEAKDAFLAICRTGVPMSEADFDFAMSWTVTPAGAPSP